MFLMVSFWSIGFLKVKECSEYKLTVKIVAHLSCFLEQIESLQPEEYWIGLPVPCDDLLEAPHPNYAETFSSRHSLDLANSANLIKSRNLPRIVFFSSIYSGI